MSASRDEVQQMVGALMSVLGGIERARKKGDAGTLAALQIVAIRGSVRPSDIALELGVHQSTITRQVQTLEAAGQVAVAADPEDRRSCFITLTGAGLAELQRLTEIGLSRFALFVEDWDAEEVRTLGRLLAKLEASRLRVNAEELRQHPPAGGNGRRWQQKAQ